VVAREGEGLLVGVGRVRRGGRVSLRNIYWKIVEAANFVRGRRCVVCEADLAEVGFGR